MKVSALVQAQVFRELAGHLRHTPWGCNWVTDEETGGLRRHAASASRQGVSGGVRHHRRAPVDWIWSPSPRGIIAATLRAAGRRRPRGLS